jgi:hypothetical protein
MEKIETEFKEIYSPNDGMSNERLVSKEEGQLTSQELTGLAGNEEVEDIFETYYNNRFD